ncbi:MAG: hypothetical protein KAQ83_00215 [Nanoarchaeota archaeon]|nr:hypothetical protein [Nanoarchaeota archaeon]
MILKELNKKQTFKFILIFALIILLIPIIVRLINYDGNPIGPIAYNNLHIANEISENNYLDQDPLAYGGSNYVQNPNHYILAYLSKLIPLGILIYSIPLIFGLFSLYIFNLIIKNLTKKRFTANLTSIILILSPIFIYLFAFPNNSYIPVFLNLLITYLILNKKPKLPIILICLLIPLFGISHAIILMVFFIILAFYQKQIRTRLFWPSMTLVVSSLFYYIPFYLKYGILINQNLIKVNIFNSFITDFGALISFSLFFIMMSILGLFMINKSNDALPLYVGSILALILSYKFPILRLYLNFVLVFIVATALIKIIKRKWQLHNLKNIAILIILCGLLFTTVSYLDRISNSEPSMAKIESLNWLKDQPDGAVLSHYSNGYWIEHLANKPTLMNPDLSKKETLQRSQDSNILFNTHHLSDTQEKLAKYEIKYIFIDQEMKNGLVWQKDNQGLLLLLAESGQFKQVYSLDGIEIWAYTG